MIKAFLLIFTISLLFLNVYAQDINSNNDLNKSEIFKDPCLIYIFKSDKIKNIDYNKKLMLDEKEYKNYRKLTDENYFKLYRILERILRANNLYYQNWRIIIKPDVDNINAYSGSANLIVINSSLYDSLYNNNDALAFVIAHELSHILLGHHLISSENLNKIQKYNKEIISNNEIIKQNQNAQMLNNVFGNNSAAVGNSIANLIILTGNAVSQHSINNIYKNERSLEYDSDSEAINLISRAGYDVNKASEAFQLLSNLPFIYSPESTHPKTEDRIANIKQVVSLTDFNELKNQGMLNIYNSKVLKLKKSSDNYSIILEKLDIQPKNPYIPLSLSDKLINKAYICYLNRNFNESSKYFKEASMINKTNYIPALYLSYIDEYKFLETLDKQFYKSSVYWAKKANRLNPNSIDTNSQLSELKQLNKDYK